MEHCKVEPENIDIASGLEEGSLEKHNDELIGYLNSKGIFVGFCHLQFSLLDENEKVIELGEPLTIKV